MFSVYDMVFVCSTDTPVGLLKVSKCSTCELIARLNAKGPSLSVTKAEATVLDNLHN